MIVTLAMHHFSLEEMVMLQYSNLATFSEWAKEDTQRTGHSKRVAERALWGQLYLDEIRKKYLTWKTTCHQEWELFLLEHLLHNVVAMWRKEWEWHLRMGHHSQQTAMAEEMASEHPSIRTLLGSPNQEILGVAEQVYMGYYELAPSVFTCWQDQFPADLLLCREVQG